MKIATECQERSVRPNVGFALMLVLVFAAGCRNGTDSDEQRLSAFAEATFLAFWQTETPDTRINYVTPLTSLDAGTEVDVARSLEVPGRARLYVPPTGGFFSVAADQERTVVRYDLAANGELERTGELSFGATGLTFFSFTNLFISETKAYLLDESQQQLVIWDPLAMEIRELVPLPMLSRELVPGGQTFAIPVTYDSLIREGRVFVPVTWQDFDNAVVASSTGLLVLNTETDEVMNFVEDERCIGAMSVVTTADGDAYFGTWDRAIIFNQAVRGNTRPSCVLRLPANGDTFDPDYLLVLADVTDGGVAANLRPSPEDGIALFRVLDEGVQPYDVADGIELQGAQAFDTWRLDLRTGEASPAPEFPKSIPETSSFAFNGTTFDSATSDDFSSTQLFRITGSGLEPAMTFPGFVTVVAESPL